METAPAPETVVRPISPDEVPARKREQLPPEVLEVFNELIIEDISNGEALVFQDEAVKRMVLRGLKRAMIDKKGWLDVEDVYREVGWKVSYDSPGYNESGPSTYRFSAPKASTPRR